MKLIVWYIFSFLFFSKRNWHQNYDMIIEMQPVDLACAVAGLTCFFIYISQMIKKIKTIEFIIIFDDHFHLRKILIPVDVTLNLFKWFHFMTSIDLFLFLIIIFIFIQYSFLLFFWQWKFNFKKLLHFIKFSTGRYFKTI